MTVYYQLLTEQENQRYAKFENAIKQAVGTIRSRLNQDEYNEQAKADCKKAIEHILINLGAHAMLEELLKYEHSQLTSINANSLTNDTESLRTYCDQVEAYMLAYKRFRYGFDVMQQWALTSEPLTAMINSLLDLSTQLSTIRSSHSPSPSSSTVNAIPTDFDTLLENVADLVVGVTILEACSSKQGLDDKQQFELIQSLIANVNTIAGALIGKDAESLQAALKLDHALLFLIDTLAKMHTRLAGARTNYEIQLKEAQEREKAQERESPDEIMELRGLIVSLDHALIDDMTALLLGHNTQQLLSTLVYKNITCEHGLRLATDPRSKDLAALYFEYCLTQASAAQSGVEPAKGAQTQAQYLALGLYYVAIPHQATRVFNRALEYKSDSVYLRLFEAQLTATIKHIIDHKSNEKIKLGFIEHLQLLILGILSYAQAREPVSRSVNSHVLRLLTKLTELDYDFRKNSGDKVNPLLVGFNSMIKARIDGGKGYETLFESAALCEFIILLNTITAPVQVEENSIMGLLKSTMRALTTSDQPTSSSASPSAAIPPRAALDRHIAELSKIAFTWATSPAANSPVASTSTAVPPAPGMISLPGMSAAPQKAPPRPMGALLAELMSRAASGKLNPADARRELGQAGDSLPDADQNPEFTTFNPAMINMGNARSKLASTASRVNAALPGALVTAMTQSTDDAATLTEVDAYVKAAKGPLLKEAQTNNTLLHLAVQAGREGLVTALLADARIKNTINDKNSEGNAALHIAAQQGNAVVYKLLTSAGASEILRNSDEKNAKALLKESQSTLSSTTGPVSSSSAALPLQGSRDDTTEVRVRPTLPVKPRKFQTLDPKSVAALSDTSTPINPWGDTLRKREPVAGQAPSLASSTETTASTPVSLFGSRKPSQATLSRTRHEPNLPPDFITALLSGDVEKVREGIAYNAERAKSLTDNMARNALLIALDNKETPENIEQIVNLLLDGGADPKHQDSRRRTAEKNTVFQTIVAKRTAVAANDVDASAGLLPSSSSSTDNSPLISPSGSPTKVAGVSSTYFASTSPTRSTSPSDVPSAEPAVQESTDNAERLSGTGLSA